MRITKITWGLGGPEEDHQLHNCCWTGRVDEREEEEEEEWIHSVLDGYMQLELLSLERT